MNIDSPTDNSAPPSLMLPGHEQVPTLQTERLLLRAWKTTDLAPFAALNADLQVMEHLDGCKPREYSDEMAHRLQLRFSEWGFGLWATALRDTDTFIGFVGLQIPGFDAPFQPCVEVGWRLAREHWGHGYASEAARRVLEFGFNECRLKEILSMTVPANMRSQAVMQRLGMTHDPGDDFDHPRFPSGHPLCRHVLYRMRPPN